MKDGFSKHEKLPIYQKARVIYDLVIPEYNDNLDIEEKAAP